MSDMITTVPKATLLMVSLCLSLTTIACDDDEVVTNQGGKDGINVTPPDSLIRCESGAVQHCGPTNCSGFMICNEDGYWPGEEGCTYPEEICDGADQDCDGSVDETFSDLGDRCTYSADECSGPGEMVCNDAKDGVICRPAQALSDAVETCDSTDEDCDGFVDEGYIVGESCSTGVGACAAEGSYVCNEQGSGVTCTATLGNPSEETCDEVDNDCDGNTDEDFPVGETCTGPGVGACVQEAEFVCSNDGSDVTCPAQEGEPGEEICDNLDNDCDGELDEAYGASQATLKVETRYHFNGSMEIEYLYDEAGNLSSKHYMNVAYPSETLEVSYVYDENGIRTQEEVSSSHLDLDGLTLVYTYDEENGQLLDIAIADDAEGRVIRYTYDEETGVKTGRDYYATVPEESLLGFEVYTYDESSNQLTMIERYGPVGPLDRTGSDDVVTTTYTYDEDGWRTSAEVEIENGSTSYVNYVYDEEGLLIEEVINGGEAGWKASMSRTQYDLEGKILYEEMDDHGDGVIDQSYTYMYTDGVLTMVAYDLDGDGIADLDLHILYDEQGLHTMTEATEAGSTEPVLSRWVYEYDEQGRAISESYDEDLDGSYEQVESYTYDELGRMLTRQVDMDGMSYEESYQYADEDTAITGTSITGDSEVTETSYLYSEESVLESVSYSAGDRLISRDYFSLSCWID